MAERLETISLLVGDGDVRPKAGICLRVQGPDGVYLVMVECVLDNDVCQPDGTILMQVQGTKRRIEPIDC